MSVNAISLIGPQMTPPSESLSASGAGQAPFASVVDQLFGDVSQSNLSADTAVRDLVMGRTDNLHGVLMRVAQADLQFRLILEIRNRLTEAYQEIMKMQV